MYHPMEFPLNGTNGTLVFVNVLSSLGPFRCGASASTVAFCPFHHDVGGLHAQDRPKKNPSFTSMVARARLRVTREWVICSTTERAFQPSAASRKDITRICLARIAARSHKGGSITIKLHDAITRRRGALAAMITRLDVGNKALDVAREAFGLLDV